MSTTPKGLWHGLTDIGTILSLSTIAKVFRLITHDVDFAEAEGRNPYRVEDTVAVLTQGSEYATLG